jgi:hypothetical protein
MHKIISTAGAAANDGAGPSGGVPQGGRPEQPVSPELQQSVPVPPQQRAPDSPRQLQQQQQQQQYQQPPAVSNGANLHNNTNLNNNGHVAVNHHVASTMQQQMHGSISFGSGNVPPVGQSTGARNALGGNGSGVQQHQHQQHYQQQRRQLPNPITYLGVPPHPSANGNHGAPQQPPAADVDYGRAASSDEGWSSESEEEEGDEDDIDQPGAAPAPTTAATGGLFPQQQHQQQEEVIEIDDYEEETGPDLLPNDHFEDPNNTHILDSPGREDPIILLGTAPNAPTGAPTGAPPPAANTNTNNIGNKDDIESSSQEDGHRSELSIPYTSRSSSAKKKKKKRKSTDPREFRRSTSPQIMNARTEGGKIPPTEPQEHFLGGEAAGGGGGGGGGGGNGNSSDKSKKQRLQSAGKSNTTTNIVVNAVMHHEEPSPRARAALLGNFNKASAAAVRSYRLPDLLMTQPPSLEQVKAGHNFEFPQFMHTTKSLSTAAAAAPTPAVAPETAAAAAAPQQHHHHQQQQQQQQQHQEIPEWGSQGPQPFTYIRHLANYVTAIQSVAPPPQQNLYLPISATICGFLKLTGTGDKRRLNFKVKVSDASGHIDAVLNEGLVLDYLNSFLQQAQETTLANNNNNNHNGGGGGNVIVHLNTVEDFFSLRKANENLFKDAIDKLRSLLESHYGLTELMIQGDLGEFPEVVQLLDASLTASQIEMLRARVQGRSR